MQRRNCHRKKRPFVAIDDFALRKRLHYGTLVVDLLTHKPIDLFPGRTEEQVKHWLLQHPSIQTVSRDGSRTYQTAITEISPSIIQVTDRWHILKGLFEATREEVYHHFPAKREDPPVIPKSPVSSSQRKSDRKREENEEKHWRMIQQVQLRHQQGESIVGLAAAFQLSRGTIYHYLTVRTPPSHKRGSSYDSYRPLVHALLQQGKKGDQIEVVCRQAGYQGSRSTLNTMIAQERKQLLPPSSIIKPKEVFQTLWRMSHPKQPTGEIKKEWEAGWPPIQQLLTFLVSFRQMFFQEDETLFDSFLQTKDWAAFPAIQRFLRRVNKDALGIRHAVTLPWSNGLAEGHVNRLKVQKAIMYGRASFDLLRKRVLYQSVIS